MTCQGCKTSDHIKGWMWEGTWEPRKESISNPVQLGAWVKGYFQFQPSLRSQQSPAGIVQWLNGSCYFLWPCPLPHTVARMVLKCESQILVISFYGPFVASCCHGVKPRHFPRGMGPCLLLSSHHVSTPLYLCWLLAGPCLFQACSVGSIFVLIVPFSRTLFFIL